MEKKSKISFSLIWVRSLVLQCRQNLSQPKRNLYCCINFFVSLYVNRLSLGGKCLRILDVGLISSLYHQKVGLQVPRTRETISSRRWFCCWLEGGRTNKDGSNLMQLRCVTARMSAEAVEMGGRSVSQNLCEDLPNSQAIPLRIVWNKILAEGGDWETTIILTSYVSYCCSSLAVSFLTQWSGDYMLKTWPRLVPSKGPWNAGSNQQTGHRGSLDILKMCFRYLGKSVDAFFQCPYGVGISHGQWDTSGTASHMEPLYSGAQARAQRVVSGLLSDSEVEEAGNRRASPCTEYRLENQARWESENQENKNKVALCTRAAS